MSIVWLASYPRSGNTWLRFLIQAYQNNGQVESRRLNADVPDIHRKGVVIDPDSAEHVLVKSHFMWSAAHPYAGQTRGFIYIVRHPKDVLLSFLQYRKLCRVLPADDPTVDRKYAMSYIRALGDPVWAKTDNMGTWPGHIESWIAKPPHPHALVKYENLLIDPERELLPVLPILGLTVDAARLRAAIEACRFSALREAEQKEKLERERGAQAGGLFEGNPEMMRRGVMFMNEGKSGRTLEHIGPDVEDSFNRTFAPHLARLSYGPTAPAAA